MYHDLKLRVTGGEQGTLGDPLFQCHFEAYAIRREDPNTMDMLARGSVGDRSPIAVLSHGRLKVTIELLPDADQ